jgi:transaldolase
MADIFLDTASVKEIKEILGWGIIQGITTNQKIFLKEKGCNFRERAKRILDMVYPFPVSLEGPNDYDGIIKAAKRYSGCKYENGCSFSNIVIKVPMLGNGDGIRAIKTLCEMGIETNATACMSLNQTFLAANAGATFVSLFYNRMIDWGFRGAGNKSTPKKTKQIIARQYAYNTVVETMNMLSKNGFDTELIVGSIRSPSDIEEIVTASPDIITIPTPILKQMPFNEMTESTLREFGKSWELFKKYEK